MVRPRGTRANRLMTKAVLTGEVRMNHDAAGRGDVAAGVWGMDGTRGDVFGFYIGPLSGRAQVGGKRASE